MSSEVWFLETAAVTGLYGLLVGMFIPALIARVPEPAPEPAPDTPAVEDDSTPATEAPEPKERYADMARLQGLHAKTALATAVVAGLIGARVGWGPELYFLLYLAPIGVALAVIDWRTRLLPTKLIAPSYVIVILLAAAAAWQQGDWQHLAMAGWGWLVAGGTFFALWFIYPKGMGYGDVRLSGILGIALGWLGWGELLTGVYAGFLLGGVGGLLLSLLRIVDRKAYPFGPFMLVGALVGVLAGPYVAGWYA